MSNPNGNNPKSSLYHNAGQSAEDGPKTIPPLRLWKIVRYNPLFQPDVPGHNVKTLEEITIWAHTVQQGPDGSLVFNAIRMVPEGFPVMFTTRMFAYWLDVEEIIVPADSTTVQ